MNDVLAIDTWVQGGLQTLKSDARATWEEHADWMLAPWLKEGTSLLTSCKQVDGTLRPAFRAWLATHPQDARALERAFTTTISNPSVRVYGLLIRFKAQWRTLRALAWLDADGPLTSFDLEDPCWEAHAAAGLHLVLCRGIQAERYQALMREHPALWQSAAMAYMQGTEGMNTMQWCHAITTTTWPVSKTMFRKYAAGNSTCQEHATTLFPAWVGEVRRITAIVEQLYPESGGWVQQEMVWNALREGTTWVPDTNLPLGMLEHSYPV